MLTCMTRWLALCADPILTNYLQTSQKHPPCRNGVSWPVLGLFCSLVLHLLDFASELSRTLQLLSQAWFRKQTNNSVNITPSDSMNCYCWRSYVTVKEKFSLDFSNSLPVIRVSLLHPCFFIIFSLLVVLYLCKVLFSGFLQFKIKFCWWSK